MSAVLVPGWEVRSLDLGRECGRVRRCGIPAVAAGCTTDTLARSTSARVLAAALGADFVEIATRGGHMWMLGDPALFSGLLGP